MKLLSALLAVLLLAFAPAVRAQPPATAGSAALDVEIEGDEVADFHRDDEHQRGLWRIASLKSFLAGRAQWRTLLDLDALSARENENWTWKGANCLPPDHRRCLISLARGDSDAFIVREYDRQAGWFATDGFLLPEGRHAIAWADEDSLFVATDYGPGSLTSSGAPRIVKLWRRGAPLDQARKVFEGRSDDQSVRPIMLVTKEGRFSLILDSRAGGLGKLYHVNDDLSLTPSPLPEDARFRAIFGGLAVSVLGGDLQVGDNVYKRGSLVGYPIRPMEAFGESAMRIQPIYEPRDGVAIAGVLPARDILYINLLDKGRNRLIGLYRGAPVWKPAPISGVPSEGALQLVSTGEKSDLILVAQLDAVHGGRLFATGFGRTRLVSPAPQARAVKAGRTSKASRRKAAKTGHRKARPEHKARRRR